MHHEFLRYLNNEYAKTSDPRLGNRIIKGDHERLVGVVHSAADELERYIKFGTGLVPGGGIALAVHETGQGNYGTAALELLPYLRIGKVAGAAAGHVPQVRLSIGGKKTVELTYEEALALGRLSAPQQKAVLGALAKTQSKADEAAILIRSGVKRVSQGAPNNVGRGVWDDGPGIRGEIIEQRLGKNLPGNFKTIDKFENGVATSIKSMDLGAKTYANPDAITRVGRGYIDKVADYNGGTWAQITIDRSHISRRALDLAVPPGATASQKQALQSLVEYGRGKGVTVNIVEIQ